MMALAQSPARLMLYAVLSAVETDLRNFIILHTHGTGLKEFLGDDLFSVSLARAVHQDELISASPTVEELLPYVDFADHFKLINAHRPSFPSAQASHIRDVTHKLEELVTIRNRVMHSRPLNGSDLTQAFEIVEGFAQARVGPWDELQATLKRFEEDPGFVQGLRIPVPIEGREGVPNNLPTPDFDETGFIGREEVVQQVKSALLGPYPVVTIVGEGGVGKTAVALKAAYERLDSEDHPFEAVIWSSSKTHTLTGTEVRRIEGSISTSLGLIRGVAVELAGSAMEDPIEDVLEYLKEFRILLVLDNLETVLDDRMTDFLGRLPVGSKVLVTSRIGIGAYEFPIKMEPMTLGDAVILMRTLARVRQVMGLVRCSNRQIGGYVERLQNNPGFIKWFVAGVQAGKRPEDLLAKPDAFLDFCLSNVYAFLRDPARAALRSLVTLPDEAGQAEIGFYADLEGVALTQAINQLLSTNMVSAHYVPSGPTYDTVYHITELARDYLAKNHPLSSEEARKIEDKRREIVAAGEKMAAAGRRDPFHRGTLALRSQRDVVSAKYLAEGLRASRRGDYSGAREVVAKARGLAPEYFEVHRVEAVTAAEAGDVLEARQSFQKALELSPDFPPLRFFYGRFLLEYLDDIEGAETEFRAALQGAPSEVTINIGLASHPVPRKAHGSSRPSPTPQRRTSQRPRSTNSR